MSAADTIDDPFRRQVAAAVAHRDRLLPLVDSVAADMGTPHGARWRRVSAALGSGDADRALVAAAADPGGWLPLFPADRDRGDRLTRVLAEARQPLLRAGTRWSLLAYPLIVVGVATFVAFLLSVTVMPAFRRIFDDFGMRLPLVTRVVLAATDLLATGWLPVTVAGLALLAGWWLAVRWNPRGPTVTAAFTRALAGLVAAGVPADEAVMLAARGVGVAPRAGLVPPLSAAAGAALRLPPAGAGRVLEAIAACHAERSRGVEGAMAWFVGPVAVGVVGMIVALLTAALFAPLIGLVTELS
jgi:hypothetical protein